MKDLLFDIFSPLKEKYPDFKIIGDEAVFSFDKDRYGKLSFTKYATHGTPNSNVFNGCEIKIMSRTKGELDLHRVAFEDVFESIFDLNHPNKIGKHIWRNNGFDWYGKPTFKDKQDLYNVVDGYLDMFRVKEVAEKSSLEEMMAAALRKTLNENGISQSKGSLLKKSYDQLISFIKEVQFMAEKSENQKNLYDLHKDETDRHAFQQAYKELIQKIQSFDEKELTKEFDKKEIERG